MQEEFVKFISGLDRSDPSARITLSDLWKAFIAQAPGDVARNALRRDLEGKIRKAFVVGTIGTQRYAGGVTLSGRPKRSWSADPNTGTLRYAFARGRGLAEAASNPQASIDLSTYPQAPVTT